MVEFQRPSPYPPTIVVRLLCRPKWISVSTVSAESKVAEDENRFEALTEPRHCVFSDKILWCAVLLARVTTMLCIQPFAQLEVLTCIGPTLCNASLVFQATGPRIPCHTITQ